jgi:DNA repair protein RadC
MMRRISRVREVAVTYGPSRGEAPRRIVAPSDAAAVFWPLVADPFREHFVAILLNGRHEYRGGHLVSIGTVSASLVHPREVFRAAIIEPGTAAIIVAHNHPSGNVTPSREDIDVTKRLVEAGDLIGIPVLDSLILAKPEDTNGGPAFASLRDAGYWPIASTKR